MPYIKLRERNRIDLDLTKVLMASCHDAADEFRRQVHEKYEDHKKRENGDCFQDFVRKQNI